jgi:predicted metalloendopeptidase
MKENITRLISFNQLKNKDFIITTESFEEILRQIKEEMAKVLKSTESAATKEEHDDLKNKLLDLETKVSKVNDENLENAELKKKLGVLETLVSEQKEVKQISFCLLIKCYNCMQHLYI